MYSQPLQDDRLATILRDSLAKQSSLPGVRAAHDPVPWPISRNSRSAPVSSVNNGGDYVAARRMLLIRYAVHWLMALHDQDADLYASLLFEICDELSEVGRINHDLFILHPPETLQAGTFFCVQDFRLHVLKPETSCGTM